MLRFVVFLFLIIVLYKLLRGLVKNLGALDRPEVAPSERTEELVKDPRSLETRRHLRKVYLDPMTGEDFVLIKEGGKIKGVKSSSTKKPFRREGFPEEYSAFEGVVSYDNWEFVFTPPKKGKAKKSTGADSTSRPSGG